MSECGTLQKHEDEGGKAYYSIQLMLTSANGKKHQRSIKHMLLV